MSEAGAARELPKYKCHKEVHALKIEEIVENPNGSVDLFFGVARYEPINIEEPDAARFKGKEGDQGYYVVYRDDYVSWSPTQEFLDGYSPIDW